MNMYFISTSFHKLRQMIKVRARTKCAGGDVILWNTGGPYRPLRAAEWTCCNLCGNASSILYCYSVNKRACFRPTAFEKGDTDGIAATFNQTEKWTGSTKGDFTQRFTCRLECYWSWTAVRQARAHTYNTHAHASPSDLNVVLRHRLWARLETMSIALSLVVTLCPSHTSICGKLYICSTDMARPGLNHADGGGEQECAFWFGISHGMGIHAAQWEKQ